MLASALSLVVIAIAWVYARPLLGIGLLVLAGAALALLIARGRKGRGSLAGSEAR